MHLVPAYIPDADYIDRQIDAELAAERDNEQNDTPYGDAEQVAS